MTKYELALVLSAKPEEEARAALLEKVKEMVTSQGGEITGITETGKRRLAYEIRKESEGFYYFIKFESEPGAPKEVESRLRITDGVLRFLIVKDELNLPAPAYFKEAAPAEAAAEAASAEPAKEIAEAPAEEKSVSEEEAPQE